ncbi:MAG: ADP-ribosylglycohydrolase family protein [Egibacteraceae bacterium]
MAATDASRSRSPEERIDAGAGALLGTLLGDAVGAPSEGAAATSLAKAGQRVERALAAAPLRYTDDTQLALALGEHLRDHPLVEHDALAEGILAVLEPWRGYGGGMLALVEEWRRGRPTDEAATAIFPDGSFGNGAAMRIAPVGVRWADEPWQLANVAARSASLTHAHPLGVDAAVAQATAVGVATTRGRFGADEVAYVAARAQQPALGELLRAARSLLADHDADADAAVGTVAEVLGTDVAAQRSVPTAIWAAAAAADTAEAVTLALALGGDVDTIAAMAGAIRGAADGATTLPEAWLAAVEEPERARALGEALARDALGGGGVS